MLLDGELPPGSFIDARITALENDYDLRADVIGVRNESSPATVTPARSRRLPLAPSTAGAYGR
jgi:hypothetical protein